MSGVLVNYTNGPSDCLVSNSPGAVWSAFRNKKSARLAAATLFKRIATNTVGKELGRVHISPNPFCKNGAELDTALKADTNLEPGGGLRLEALGPVGKKGDDVVTGKLVRLSGYRAL